MPSCSSEHCARTGPFTAPPLDHAGSFLVHQETSCDSIIQEEAPAPLVFLPPQYWARVSSSGCTTCLPSKCTVKGLPSCPDGELVAQTQNFDPTLSLLSPPFGFLVPGAEWVFIK